MQKNLHEKTGFVFVNGAGLESRIWSRVVEGLEHPCLPVEFPLRKSSVHSRRRLSLEDYVTHIKKQVDEWGSRRFVIVAHSLGGVLALKLASELSERLAGFIAVGAIIPKNGGSFLSIMPFPKRILLSVLLRTMSTNPPESVIRAGLCSDLSPDQATEIVQGFIPEAVRVYTDRVNAAIPDVPKLYVKLTKDKELSPPLQNQLISNFSPQSVRTLDTGHLPMISDPDGLMVILEEFMESVR